MSDFKSKLKLTASFIEFKILYNVDINIEISCY